MLALRQGTERFGLGNIRTPKAAHGTRRRGHVAIRRGALPQYYDVVAFEEEDEGEQLEEGQQSGPNTRAAATAPPTPERPPSPRARRRLRLGVVTSAVPADDSDAVLTIVPLRKASDWTESRLWVEAEEDETAAGQ